MQVCAFPSDIAFCTKDLVEVTVHGTVLGFLCTRDMSKSRTPQTFFLWLTKQERQVKFLQDLQSLRSKDRCEMLALVSGRKGDKVSELTFLYTHKVGLTIRYTVIVKNHTSAIARIGPLDPIPTASRTHSRHSHSSTDSLQHTWASLAQLGLYNGYRRDSSERMSLDKGILGVIHKVFTAPTHKPVVGLRYKIFYFGIVYSPFIYHSFKSISASNFLFS
jgi:hypothetical protein